MRSGKLPTYLSLNRLSNAILFNISLFLGNSPRVTDRPTNGRTNTATYKDARMHLKSIKIRCETQNRVNKSNRKYNNYGVLAFKINWKELKPAAWNKGKE